MLVFFFLLSPFLYSCLVRERLGVVGIGFSIFTIVSSIWVFECWCWCWCWYFNEAGSVLGVG